MKFKTHKIVSATLIAAVFFLNSCKKEETLVNDSTDNLAAAVVESQMAMNTTMFKMQSLLPKLIAQKTGSFKNEGLIGEMDCATITIDSSSSPFIAYFDFGLTGCRGSDGIFYSGNVTAQFINENMDQPGDWFSFNFRNFRQDTVVMNGDMRFTYNGINGNGNETTTLYFNVRSNTSSNAIPINGENTFQSETFLRDSTTSSDDQVRITGGGTVITNGGSTYTQTVTTPLLLVDQSCSEFFVAGTLLLTAPGIRSRTIDYGTGTCDNKATITSGGTTRTISLH